MEGDMSNLRDYHFAPNRNAIINGGMDVWQRGTATLTNPAGGTYFPDRFSFQHSIGDGTYNLLQSAEIPAVGFPFQYGLKLDCTNIETAVAAGEFIYAVYFVEGYDFKRFEGEVATLSFWVKAVKTGIYCVSFTNSAFDKSYVHEFTINSASTWEKKTVTLTFNGGGTFLYTNGCGLRIAWAIMMGSTFQIATANKNTWQAGGYLATDAQVNGLDNAANNFWLTGVQLELGSVATPFEVRPFAQELALCQRYFEKSYNTDVAPGSATAVGMCGNPFQTGANTNVYLGAMAAFKVKKRTTPTMAFYDAAGTVGKVSTHSVDGAGQNNISHTGPSQVGEWGAGVYMAVAGNKCGIEFHYTASAEL